MSLSFLGPDINSIIQVLPEAEVETVIMYRVLPCLVRMCKKEETTNNRIIAAETLAYLIEVSPSLHVHYMSA